MKSQKKKASRNEVEQFAKEAMFAEMMIMMDENPIGELLGVSMREKLVEVVKTIPKDKWEELPSVIPALPELVVMRTEYGGRILKVSCLKIDDECFYIDDVWFE